MSETRALIIDDEPNIAELCRRILNEEGLETSVATTAKEGLRLFERSKPDIVLLDMMLPEMNGMQVLEKMKKQESHAQIIIITAYATIGNAVEAIKAGAFDYLSKPFMPDELKLTVDKAIEHRRLKEKLQFLQEKDVREYRCDKMLGDSPEMKAVHKTIGKITDLLKGNPQATPTVLIRGETGTGKDLVAKAIHYQGARADCPFIEVNCPAIPEALMEGELFGYEKGAFTDAKSTKKGLFEAADGGTLFLDEVGCLPLGMQAKLLKVIEDKRVRRLGSLADRKVDVRIIAATNRNLEEAVSEGAFRADFFYRLKVMTVELPPLRARGRDVLLVAQHFLTAYAKRYGKRARALTEPAEKAITHYHWPGNVRELKHVIERAVIWSDDETVGPDHLLIQPPRGCGTLPRRDVEEGEPGSELAPPGLNLGTVEKELIRKALKQATGNCTKAAALLGLSRDTLRYRLKKHRLNISQCRVK